MNLQCLFFIFSLALATPNFLERKARWSTEILGETEEELLTRILAPLPEGTRYEEYRPDAGIAIIHNDIWHVIAHTLDPFSVWNFGLTCKYFAAMVRDSREGLFNCIFHPAAFRIILWNSQLTLYGHMESVLRPILEAYEMHLPTSVSENLKDGRAMKKMFRLRAGDFEIAILPVADIWHLNEAGYISPSITKHLFRQLKGERIFFLPPVGTKLFDRLDAREVAQLIQTRFYKSSFCYCLLMDYIIPSYGNSMHGHQLTNLELTALRFLNLNNSVGFRPYFESLQWAIFFLTEATRVNDGRSKKIRTPIANHLAHVGLAWKDLWQSKGFSSLKEWMIRKKLDMMPAILLAAKHWGLDWMAIAETTSGWAPICQQILDGDIPQYLSKDFTLTLPEMVRIFTNDFVEPIYLNNGKWVAASSLLSARMKRPRPANDLEERPKKQRKLESELSVPLACIQTIQESLQKLAEAGIANFRVLQVTETMMELCGALNNEFIPLDVEDFIDQEETDNAIEQDVLPYFHVPLPRPLITYEPEPVMAGAMLPPAPVMLPPAPVMLPPAPVMLPPAPVMLPPAPVMLPPAPGMLPQVPAMLAPAPVIPPYALGMGYGAPMDANDDDTDIYLN